jgi:hypothetical protein
MCKIRRQWRLPGHTLSIYILQADSDSLHLDAHSQVLSLTSETIATHISDLEKSSSVRARDGSSRSGLDIHFYAFSGHPERAKTFQEVFDGYRVEWQMAGSLGCACGLEHRHVLRPQTKFRKQKDRLDCCDADRSEREVLGR